jgi:hypothetical protein
LEFLEKSKERKYRCKVDSKSRRKWSFLLGGGARRSGGGPGRIRKDGPCPCLSAVKMSAD